MEQNTQYPHAGGFGMYSATSMMNPVTPVISSRISSSQSEPVEAAEARL